MEARNLQAAHAALAGVVAEDIPAAESVGLFEILERARRRDGPALARVSNDEARELLELALMGCTLPEGVAAEAALGYLVALRQGLPPVAAAFERIEALGGGRGDADELGDWFEVLAWHHKRAAARLEALRVIREARND